jgi:hypothetical protein
MSTGTGCAKVTLCLSLMCIEPVAIAGIVQWPKQALAALNEKSMGLHMESGTVWREDGLNIYI